MKTYRKILFGKKAKYTYFGLRSCSHGMYSRGGYDFYVYGIKGIVNIIIDKRWGDFIPLKEMAIWAGMKEK